MGTARAEFNSPRRKGKTRYLAAKARSYIAHASFTKAEWRMLLTSTNVCLTSESKHIKTPSARWMREGWGHIDKNRYFVNSHRKKVQSMNLIARCTDDPKRERILDGAMKVFLAYGFARTTMDDIARSADVSRPALYLQFRNKADIFRAIGACVLEQSLEGARQGLAEEGTFGERMMTALDRALFGLIETIDQSAHGQEILDMENKIAADIIAEWRDGLTAIVEAAVADEASRTNADLEGQGLSARGLAEILLDGLEGMRMRGLCGKPAIDGARRLVRVLEISMAAAQPERG